MFLLSLYTYLDVVWHLERSVKYQIVYVLCYVLLWSVIGAVLDIALRLHFRDLSA